MKILNCYLVYLVNRRKKVLDQNSDGLGFVLQLALPAGPDAAAALATLRPPLPPRPGRLSHSSDGIFSQVEQPDKTKCLLERQQNKIIRL